MFGDELAHVFDRQTARIGLRTQGPLAGILPTLVRTQGMREVPDEAVYVGQGNHRLKLAKTKWSSPFLPGPHGTPEACVRKYAHWLQSQPGLYRQAQALEGVMLLCDCPPQEPCHGDALVAAVFMHHTAHGSRQQQQK